MKNILILIIFILLSNCSLNKNSKYWNQDLTIKKDQKISSSIPKKDADIRTMNTKEYKIFIDEHIKKSKYPDIAQ